MAQALALRAAQHSLETLVEAPAPCKSCGEELSVDGVVRESDVIFVLGGDGTLLRAARTAAPAGKPLVGVHFGRYGFIMDTSPEAAVEALEKVISGEFSISNRLMLKMELVRGGKCVGEHSALNDVVVTRGPISRLLRLRVEVGHHEVVRYSADGIIAATPTGSTAYSLSAGGPVVHPDVDVIVLTPIAPHTLNSRSLVIPAGEVMEINCMDSPKHAVMTVDGQLLEDVQPGDIVRITRAPFSTQLVQTRPSAFYEQLESRLGFGERFDR